MSGELDRVLAVLEHHWDFLGSAVFVLVLAAVGPLIRAAVER